MGFSFSFRPAPAGPSRSAQWRLCTRARAPRAGRWWNWHQNFQVLVQLLFSALQGFEPKWIARIVQLHSGKQNIHWTTLLRLVRGSKIFTGPLYCTRSAEAKFSLDHSTRSWEAKFSLDHSTAPGAWKSEVQSSIQGPEKTCGAFNLFVCYPA